jgi:serine-type D-Ala-D-Ala carboxypeptidase/endopeptidase
VQDQNSVSRWRALVALAGLALLLCSGVLSLVGAQGLADPLSAALAKRVDEAKEGTGAIVGRLTPRGRSFTAYGRTRADGSEITAETIFEIGSITKVFTALLLADMVERGEVRLNDAVREYLPSGVTVPSRGRREITLADLATHTSGLPRDPANLDLRSLVDPYAEYRAADLYEFLATYSLQRDPGTQFEYSNVGMGLLGHVLAARAGVSYEELLARRVLGPLGMRNTSVVVDEERRARRATGHTQAQAPVPWWHFDSMAGAGAINSTASDMLVFAEAAMGTNTPLKAAFTRMTSIRRPVDRSTDQVLGWDAFRYQGNDVLAKSGVTNGFRSRLFVDPTGHRAVIVLSNGGGPAPINDLVALALAQGDVGR